jgi:hypothetical protein
MGYEFGIFSRDHSSRLDPLLQYLPLAIFTAIALRTCFSTR